MRRQSFATWHVPADLDGLVISEDVASAGGTFSPQERHAHAELELHLVERGRGLFVFAQGRLPLSAGTLVFVPPGVDHLLLEASTDFRRAMLLCRTRAVRRALPAAACSQLLPPRGQLRSGLLAPRDLATLRDAFARLRAEQRADRKLVNAGVAYGLARAWAAFGSASPSAAVEAFRPAVAEALRLLRAASLALPELAQRVGLSESHLSKLFQAQVGASVTEVRNRIRIERFLELYGDGTRATLTQAAIDAGFGSYPQFHRVFRAQLGCSPAAHAKSKQVSAPR
jgi:AraC-like DNA-binding protein